MSAAKDKRPLAGVRQTARRRRGAWVAIFFAVLLLGGVVALFRGNVERVNTLWVGAEIAADGGMRVTEVIDYDFGAPHTTRHGIYRDLPDLPYDADSAEVSVTMDGVRMPWELDVGDRYEKPDGQREIATRIKVGDPDDSVTGVHRYRIQYTLSDVVQKGKIAWNAVGTGWQVDRSDVQIHVVAPYQLIGARCVQGTDGSVNPCTARPDGPGRLDVTLDRLHGHEGVTLYASGGQKPTGVPQTLPAPPSGAKAVGTTVESPLRVALFASCLTALCAGAAVGLLRLLGRDRTAQEGPGGPPGRIRRGLARRSAAPPPSAAVPPEGLSPAQGGILLAERVESHHQVAWLLSMTIEGRITVGGTAQNPTLRRRETADAPDDPAGSVDASIARSVLDTIFAGRDWVTLGPRDAQFRAGWQFLHRELAVWQETSDLWDEAAANRARLGRPVGIAATLLGFVTTAVGAWLGGGRHASGRTVLLLGLLAVGVGLALWLRSWELHRRSPRGTDLRLRTQAFQRYLADPSALSGDEPLDAERLELYTAWAVALDAAHAWDRAVADSTAAPRHRSTLTSGFFPGFALGLITASATSSVPPPSSSSNSSGGGSGAGFSSGSSGGVGGGSGGGGGGSW
ncbi:DUF2207 domain-containing protein [Streptomyces sp. NPDC102467]|uniref:DUF2207 domain-containing protein n=1 Tax=Streptomyces sp. NPDC102467 TaxID=3366179 RepID=UPI00380E8959